MILQDDFRKQIGEISFNSYPLSNNKFEVILEGRFKLVFSDYGVDLFVLTNNMKEFYVGRDLIDEPYLTIAELVDAYHNELC